MREAFGWWIKSKLDNEFVRSLVWTITPPGFHQTSSGSSRTINSVVFDERCKRECWQECPVWEHLLTQEMGAPITQNRWDELLLCNRLGLFLKMHQTKGLTETHLFQCDRRSERCGTVEFRHTKGVEPTA